jgi:hypothetical protein
MYLVINTPFSDDSLLTGYLVVKATPELVAQVMNRKAVLELAKEKDPNLLQLGYRFGGEVTLLDGYDDIEGLQDAVEEWVTSVDLIAGNVEFMVVSEMPPTHRTWRTGCIYMVIEELAFHFRGWLHDGNTTWETDGVDYDVLEEVAVANVKGLTADSVVVDEAEAMFKEAAR